MRIISGKYRGKIIHAPKGLPVRPTTDFAKTGLFNIINNLGKIADMKVLDLFSGTGNITYEFVSRGCKSITSVEQNLNCIKFIDHTLQSLNAANVNIVKSDVFVYLNNSFLTFDLIFADPPFELEAALQLPGLIFEKQLLNKNGWFIMEHRTGKNFSSCSGFYETRKYGQVSFSFFNNSGT